MPKQKYTEAIEHLEKVVNYIERSSFLDYIEVKCAEDARDFINKQRGE